MARNTDDIAIESSSTQRKRLRQAFLFGQIENRRKFDSGWNSFIVSLILAALICVGCVGYSFITQILQSQSSQANPATPSPTSNPVSKP